MFRFLRLISLCLLLVSMPALAAYAQDKPAAKERRNRAAKARVGEARAKEMKAGEMALPLAQLNRLGATEEEKAAIRTLLQAKRSLTRSYRQEIMPLFALVKNPSTTPEQFAKAVSDLETAKRKYVQAIEKEEATAKKKLSPKIQLALYAVGILDNGLPAPPHRPGGPQGPGAPGGPAGPPPAPAP